MLSMVMFGVQCLCGNTGDGLLCGQCEKELLRPISIYLGGYESVRATGSYENRLKELVLELKSGNRSIIPAISALMFRSLHERYPRFDAVTWIPPSKRGHRQRGFDQSQLLAQQIANLLDVQCFRTVRRTDKASQHSRSRVNRNLGPTFRKLREVKGSLLVVDDVITTGVTLRRYQQLFKGQADLKLTALCMASAN